jgi:ABC-type phosphate transport system substrate-binding protein
VNRKFGRRAAIMVAGAAALIGAAAPAAQAAWTAPYTTQCSGESLVGRGASFQNTLHNGLVGPPAVLGIIGKWYETGAQQCGTWPENGKTITYPGGGSGAGRTVMGAGTTTSGVSRATAAGALSDARFGGTDEPPTAAQEADIEDGDPGDPNDNGVLHTIPIASGAVPIIVNYPDGCSIPTAFEYKPNASNQTTRIKLSNSRVEQVFQGNTSRDTWGELVTGITGTWAGDGVTPCASLKVKRVVRRDVSGTTFTVKQWFKTIRPTFSWLESEGLGNTSWPNATNPGSATLVIPPANGNGSLADTVNANDGSIGYGDLATARDKGFTMTPSTPPAAPDTTFWIPTYNGAGVIKEPQINSTGYLTGGARGANCANTTYNNVPASTLDNWVAVTGIPSTSDYGICTLTYVMAFDDHADVWGNSAAEQGKARTTRDYLFYLLNGGQNNLQNLDYAKVPNSILSVMRPSYLGSVNFDKP